MGVAILVMQSLSVVREQLTELAAVVLSWPHDAIPPGGEGE